MSAFHAQNGQNDVEKKKEVNENFKIERIFLNFLSLFFISMIFFLILSNFL
jgi:hypothetical protein